MDMGALALGIPTFGGITKGLGALGNIVSGEGDVEDVGDARKGIKDGEERLAACFGRKKNTPPGRNRCFQGQIF